MAWTEVMEPFLVVVIRSCMAPAEQGGYFGTGLGEAENVVDKQEHILAFDVTEVLGDGQTGEGDPSPGTWGLVHLAVDEGDLGVGVVEGDNTTLNHLVVEIVTLPSPLADTGKDRVTTMTLGDVVNQLHNKDGLADTSTAEQTNLTSLDIRGQEIDDLDTGLQNLLGAAGLGHRRGLGVDGVEHVGLDRASLVDGLADDVDDAAEGAGADGHLDGGAGVVDGLTPDQPLGGVHGDGPDSVLA